MRFVKSAGLLFLVSAFLMTAACEDGQGSPLEVSDVIGEGPSLVQTASDTTQLLVSTPCDEEDEEGEQQGECEECEECEDDGGSGYSPGGG